MLYIKPRIFVYYVLFKKKFVKNLCKKNLDAMIILIVIRNFKYFPF